MSASAKLEKEKTPNLRLLKMRITHMQRETEERGQKVYDPKLFLSLWIQRPLQPSLYGSSVCVN